MTRRRMVADLFALAGLATITHLAVTVGDRLAVYEYNLATTGLTRSPPRVAWFLGLFTYHHPTLVAVELGIGVTLLAVAVYVWRTMPEADT